MISRTAPDFFQIGVLPAESLAMGLLLRFKMLCLGVVGFVTYLTYKYSDSAELDQLERFARKNENEIKPDKDFYSEAE